MKDKKQDSKDRYYLNIAEAVAMKSTCMRRMYGAIIVKNDEIISTGYNGSPRGCLNCNEVGCIREAFGTRKGDAYNLCASVHAEQNAIISASRRDMIGATIYIVGVNALRPLLGAEPKDPSEYKHYADPSPCLLCHRLIVNSGIIRAVGIKNVEGTDQAEPYEIDITGEFFMKRVQHEYIKELGRQKEAGMPKSRYQRIDRLIKLRATALATSQYSDIQKASEEALEIMRGLERED